MMRSTEASPHKRLKPVALVSPSWRISPKAPLALSTGTSMKLKFALLLASPSLLFGPVVGSALAASPQTDAFVTNARPNVDFIDSASRLALDKATTPRLRAFAHQEAEEQTIAGNAFVAWAETHTAHGEAVALGGGASTVTTPVGGVLNGAGSGVNQVLSPLGPVGAIAAAPLTVAGGVTNGVGTVVDGTVAGILPGAVAPASQGPLIGAGLLPANRDDIERLKSLTGRQFDALYRSTQQDALRQLATLYRDYATSGDDPALRSLASSELPKVNRRLEEIARF